MELRFKLVFKSGRTLNGTVVTAESPAEWLARNLQADLLAFTEGTKVHAVVVSEIESAEAESLLAQLEGEG